MSSTYLPARHSLLALEAFYRRILKHREKHESLDYDLEPEEFAAIQKKRERVASLLSAFAEVAQTAANYNITKIQQGVVYVVDVFGRSRIMPEVWIDKEEWPKMPTKVSKPLGYCILHDASFETTVAISMEWFDEMHMLHGRRHVNQIAGRRPPFSGFGRTGSVPQLKDAAGLYNIQ